MTARLFTAVFLLAIFWAAGATAAPTRVGNGDDGGDLEKGSKVTSGILIETRKAAADKLRQLNIGGIEGLGQLLNEVEKAPLILVRSDIDANKTKAAPEDKEKARDEARAIGAPGNESPDGQLPVYARTFPEPHAATRFFPSALLLDRDQLVALYS